MIVPTNFPFAIFNKGTEITSIRSLDSFSSKNHSKELQKILKFKLHELSNDTQAHDIVTAVPQRVF